MVRLAEKAFAPGKVPFPLMHIDSKWKFKEMIQQPAVCCYAKKAEAESEIKSTAPKRRLLGNRSHACTGLKKYLKGFAPHSSSPRHTACRRTALLQAACQLIYKLSFNQLRNMSAEQKLPRLLFFLSLHRRQSVGTRLNLA